MVIAQKRDQSSFHGDCTGCLGEKAKMTLQDAEGRDLYLLSTYCVSGTEQALLPLSILPPPLPSRVTLPILQKKKQDREGQAMTSGLEHFKQGDRCNG